MARPKNAILDKGGLSPLFSSLVKRANLADASTKSADILADLNQIAWVLSEDDDAGQAWCEENNYVGYTNYGSINDLPQRFSVVGQLVKMLDKMVAEFAADCHFDLCGRPLVLDNIWVNILPEGGIHTGHIHPHSVISGTLYLDIPNGASALKFEDPRLAMMMASPMRNGDAPAHLQQFIYATPKAGDVLLWESWLRHEVLMNMAEDERVSISFNYRW